MRLRFKTILSITAIIVLFTGCQYELSGEFVNQISKPDNSHNGTIVLSKDIDSIVIYEPTEFQYSVNSFGLQCNGIQLEYLNTKIKNQIASSGTFKITPDFNIKGWFDLKATFYLGTGTGSIADKFKAENYVGTKTWKVLFVNITKWDFKFQQHVNKDGFLELFFIKPRFSPLIYSSINNINTIQPLISKVVGDTTFFVDSTYYGGNTNSYKLNIQLNYYSIIYTKTLNPDYPFPELKVTPFGLDSAIVSWTKSPLKVFYKVYYGNAWKKYIYSGFENSCRAKYTIATTYGFYLEIYPFDYNKDKYNYKAISTNFNNGESANYKFQYSYVKDQFYIPSTNNPSQLEKVDLTSTEGNSYANSSINKYNLWGNQLGTRFVSFNSGNIHIFDENLNEVKVQTICNPNEYYGGQMTTDDCFAYYNYNKSLYIMINVAENPIWQQFSFKPSAADETYHGIIRLSLDGKYAFWQGDKYFIIYDVSNHTNAKIVYQCPNSEVFSVLGNPLNYKEVIISKTDKIEVRSLPDFQLIKQVNFDGLGLCYLVNFDTFSNSVLAAVNNSFHIINLANMKDVLTFNASNEGWSSARLQRNILFLNGTRRDLTPYLKKP